MEQSNTPRLQPETIMIRLILFSALLIGLLMIGIAIGRLAWAAFAVQRDLDAAQELIDD